MTVAYGSFDPLCWSHDDKHHQAGGGERGNADSQKMKSGRRSPRQRQHTPAHHARRNTPVGHHHRRTNAADKRRANHTNGSTT